MHGRCRAAHLLLVLQLAGGRGEKTMVFIGCGFGALQSVQALVHASSPLCMVDGMLRNSMVEETTSHRTWKKCVDRKIALPRC